MIKSLNSESRLISYTTRLFFFSLWRVTNQGLATSPTRLYQQPVKMKTSFTQPMRCHSYQCTFPCHSIHVTFPALFHSFDWSVTPSPPVWLAVIPFVCNSTVIMKKLHQLKNSMFIYYRKLTFLTINCSRGVFFLTNLGTNLNCAWASVVLPKIPIVTGQEDSNSSVKRQ